MQKKTITPLALLALCVASAQAQDGTALRFTTQEDTPWQVDRIETSATVIGQPQIVLSRDRLLQEWKGWGTCFNEIGYDALLLLPQTEQERVMRRLFDPDGDLRFSVGRFSVGANDYARSWYSCDEIDTDSTDFQMEHFNIDRDLNCLIPYIQWAQRYNPDMTFWCSPWSPPTWMKADKQYNNQNYPVYFSDQFIMEEDYLNAYCLYFDKFITAYAEQGIPITELSYQNEAYSYVVYPGCSWTAGSTATFLGDYLGPYMAEHHPDVQLQVGTFNTASTDVIEEILSHEGVQEYFSALGFQWEGNGAMREMAYRHPAYALHQTESECGSGTFDWAAAEHTFDLYNDYVSGGCDKYTYWNAILQDNGSSTWGWLQNALIQVNSSTCEAYYTNEYYAVKHYTHFIPEGSHIMAGSTNNPMLLAALTPDDQIVIVTGNLDNTARTVTVDADGEYLALTLQPNTFYTLVLAADDEQLTLLTAEANQALLDLEETDALYEALTQAIDSINTDDTEQSIERLLSALAGDTSTDTIDIDISEAGTDNPVDLSAYITNADFSNGTSSWTLDNVLTTSDVLATTIQGRTCLNSWSNNFTSMNVYQDLTGLPAGVYTLSCYSLCGPGEINDQHAYATAQGLTATSPVKTVGLWSEEGWEQQTTEKILVGDNGTLRIGYASTSGGSTVGWFCVTDFTLAYYGEDSTYVAPEDTSLETALAAFEDAWASAQALAESLTTEQATQALETITATQQARATDENATADDVNAAAELLTYAATYIALLEQACLYVSDEEQCYADDEKDALATVIDQQLALLDQVDEATLLDNLCRQLDTYILAVRLTLQPSEDTDFTFAIQAPDVEEFDDDDLPLGWDLSTTNGDSYYKNGEHWSGNSADHYFDSYNATSGWLWYTGHQTLANLPNGTYQLQCYARTSGEGSYITARTETQFLMEEIVMQGEDGNEGGPVWEEAESGTAEKLANSGNGYGWQQMTISDILVTDGLLTIGFTNDYYLTDKQWTGTWFSVDDYTLTYLSADTETAITSLSTASDGTWQVRGGKGCIIVSGTNSFRIYDTAGQLTTRTTGLPAGIYIVSAGTQNRKVVVR